MDRQTDSVAKSGRKRNTEWSGLVCVAWCSVRASEPNLMSSPFFPLDVLKQLMMENLTEAVMKGAAHIRDPIGGSNETLFVYVILTLRTLESPHSRSHRPRTLAPRTQQTQKIRAAVVTVPHAVNCERFWFWRRLSAVFCLCMKYLRNRWADLRQIHTEDVFVTPSDEL